jgi:uncharacterized protein (TIGR03086 family)
VTAQRPALLLGGVGLLERAIGYVLGALGAVTPANLDAPTPCHAWNLGALLAHLDESLLALHEAASGHVGLAPARPFGDVATVRTHASRLLGAWAGSTRTGVTIGDAGLTAGILTCTGAVEIAVHGWDVAAATGRHHPLPAALAEDLLDLAPFLVSDVDRPARFADPVPVPAHATAGVRLIAFLGRCP